MEAEKELNVLESLVITSWSRPESRIAVWEVRAFLDQDTMLERVVFVAFDAATHDAYRRALGLGT